MRVRPVSLTETRVASCNCTFLTNSFFLELRQGFVVICILNLAVSVGECLDTHQVAALSSASTSMLSISQKKT